MLSSTCFLDLVDFRVGIPSVPCTSSSSSWAISAVSVVVVVSPSSNAKSIVFSYHSSSTLTVPSSTSSHGIEYSRIPYDTTVVFLMPDSVKWNDVAVLSRFNMKLQRWQALSVPSLYKHAVASSRSASFNSLDSVISEYETKATTRRTDRAVWAVDDQCQVKDVKVSQVSARWDIRDFGVCPMEHRNLIRSMTLVSTLYNALLRFNI